jgi:hypothetical protein
VLFRDLGPIGMERFLSGTLKRLAGPMAPILYLRTARYIEPYTDHEEIGRLAVLVPKALEPWHSGVAEVYVASAGQAPLPQHMAFVPTAWASADGMRILEGLADAAAIREALGGRLHDEYRMDLAARLRTLQAELEASERLARPVRQRLQSGAWAEREAARRDMEQHGISERDLCSAWHHIPRGRRAALDDWLARAASKG